jgi:hypothetical protein
VLPSRISGWMWTTRVYPGFRSSMEHHQGHVMELLLNNHHHSLATNHVILSSHRKKNVITCRFGITSILVSSLQYFKYCRTSNFNALRIPNPTTFFTPFFSRCFLRPSCCSFFFLLSSFPIVENSSCTPSIN